MVLQLLDIDKQLLDAVAKARSFGEAHMAPILFGEAGSITRGAQRLNALIDHEAALAYRPQLVNALRAHRERRRPRRTTC